MHELMTILRRIHSIIHPRLIRARGIFRPAEESIQQETAHGIQDHSLPVSVLGSEPFQLEATPMAIGTEAQADLKIACRGNTCQRQDEQDGLPKYPKFQYEQAWLT